MECLLQIPVYADLPVGYNFHDHSGTTLDFTLSPQIMRYTDKLRNPENIKRYINDRTGRLNLSSKHFLIKLSLDRNGLF